MPLGMKVGLGPRHIVLDGDPAPSKGVHTPIFGQCLFWPNGRPSQLLLNTSKTGNHASKIQELVESTDLAILVEQVERTMVHFSDPPVALTTAVDVGCMQRQTMLGCNARSIHLTDLARKHKRYTYITN